MKRAARAPEVVGVRIRGWRPLPLAHHLPNRRAPNRRTQHLGTSSAFALVTAGAHAAAFPAAR